MVDTLYICYKCKSKKQYDDLFARVKCIARKRRCNLFKVRNQEGKYKTFALNSIGFLEIVFHATKTRAYQLEIKFKPKKIIKPYEYASITHYSEIPEVRERFNEIIRRISSDLPDFFDWECYRVDYAINISTPYVREYVYLLSRGNIYDYFVKYPAPEEVVYLQSARDGVTVNFYDKYIELRANRDKIGEKDNYAKAKNILRLEVQCNNRKLHSLKNKFALPAKQVRYFLQPEIAKDVISYYHGMLAGNEDYVSFDQAIELIQNFRGDWGYKFFDDFPYVVKLIADRQGVSSAREAFAKGKSAFDKRICKIRQELAINPVAIPSEWNLPYLVNLRKKTKAVFSAETGLRVN